MLFLFLLTAKLIFFTFILEATSANRSCAEFDHRPVATSCLEGRNIQFLASANAMVLRDNKTGEPDQVGLVFKWFVAGRRVQTDGEHFLVSNRYKKT